MATNYYLVINGIAGDYSDDLLTGAFKVDSFDLPTTNDGTVTDDKVTKGATTFNPLKLSLDSETLAGLLADAANGKLISGASLVGETTVDGQSAITYSLNLSNVIVSDVSDPSSGQGIGVSLNYGQIGLATYAQDSSGALQPAQQFAWNVLTNQSGSGSGKSLTSANVATQVTPTTPTTYYLLVNGVDGGSTDPGHVGWFELTDFNIDVTNATVASNNKEEAHQPGAFGDLSVTTSSDSGLTALLAHETSDGHFGGVRIEGVDGNGDAVYDLNLADVLVTGIDDQNPAGVGIDFDYQKISLVTQGQNPDGSLTQTGSFGWDVIHKAAIDPSTMPSLSPGTDSDAITPTSYYLVVNGIAGDYTDDLLTGAFKVDSFDLPTTNDGTVTDDKVTKGATTFNPLKLSLDSETLAGLLADAANGKLISGASLVGETTVGGQSAITYSLNLSQVIVSDVSDPSSGQGIGLSLNYGQIGLATYGQDSSGALQPAQQFAWNVLTKQSVAGSGKSLTSANVATQVTPTTPTTYYLLVDGVDGGSTDAGHAGWFELTDFNIDVTNATVASNNKEVAHQPGAFGDLSVTTSSDSGLTALLAHETSDGHFGGVRIEGVDGNGDAVYDLNLANVLVTGVDDQNPAGVGIDFDYGKISLVTQGQNLDGSLTQTGSFGWDVIHDAAIDPSTMPSLSPGTDSDAITPTSYHLVVNGIAGDYTDDLLTGAFKVDSFDLPTTNDGTVTDDKVTKGATTFNPLKLSLDSETLAGLLANAANGKLISGASLVGETTVGGQSAITYSLNLSNVIVSDVSDPDSGQGIDLSLKYGQIGLATYGQDSSGALQPAQQFAWNVLTNASGSGSGTSRTSANVATQVTPTTPMTYYLLVDGVDGGSTDADHAGWFELTDFNIDVKNATAPIHSKDGTVDRGVFGDLSVTTSTNSGLTALLAHETSDGHFDGVRIEGVDGNGDAVYDLNLANVLVTGVDDQNPAGVGIDFDYGRISLVTQGQNPDGSLTQTGSFGWDVIHNVAIDPSTMPDIAPCYCPGTLILTERGEVPVEDLAIGDTVMTMSGAARPIKWIGRRAYLGRFALGRKDILPVCIKAGAIDDNVPRRDLWISPHHAMYLDGLLIEARDLINEVTITQATEVERVEYYHIELESHDVIIAEGSLSESFVDDDSRGMFHNVHEYTRLYPAETNGSVRYCAPRCDSGYSVEAARRRLALRAGSQMAKEEAGIGQLRGYIDWIGFDRIGGWAQNVDHPEASVCLDICVNGRLIGQTLANHYRGDLKQAGVGSGRHGFEFVPPAALNLTTDTIEVRRSLDHAALELSYDDRRAIAS